MSSVEKAYPIGMAVVLAYFGLASVGYLFACLLLWAGVFEVQSGWWAAALGFPFFVAGILVIVGVLRRRQWGWRLVLGVLAYGIVGQSIALFVAIGQPNASVLLQYAGLVSEVALVGYLYRRRAFFSR